MATPTVYRAGEVLDVTLRVRVVEDSNLHHCLNVTYRQPEHLNASPYPLNLPLRSPDMTITRLAPAEWPPQPSELWAAGDGVELFATAGTRSDEAWMVSGDAGRAGYASDMLAVYGPMRRVYPPVESAPAADVDQPDEPEQPDERAASAALLRHIADGIDAGLPVPWTVSDRFDLYLYAPGSGAGPDTAAVDAWVAHIDPAGQATSREHGYDAKLVWRGACEVKVWTPAPRPAAEDIPPSPPEEVAGLVAAGPATATWPEEAAYWTEDADGDPVIPKATAPEFDLGPLPELCGNLKPHGKHSWFDDKPGLSECPGVPLTDEQTDGAVVVLAEALDANPELLDEPAVETDADMLDQLGVAVTGADEVDRG